MDRSTCKTADASAANAADRVWLRTSDKGSSIPVMTGKQPEVLTDRDRQE
jgi:hypothetical protein